MFDLKIDRMTSKYGERKHKETSALLQLSQYFDDTHNDRSSSAASSQTHLSSLQRKHQVGIAMLPSPQFAAGYFRVRGSYITCRIDALHVNNILCCIFLSK